MAVIKYGNIVEVNPEDCTVRVEFPENQMVSFPIPVMVQGTKDKYFTIFDEGERVVCMMDERCEHGVVLGAIYDSNNKPEAGGNSDINRVKFSDGTLIQYDRGNSTLEINTGTTTIKAAPAGVEISRGSESAKSIISDFIDAVINAITLSPESGAPNTLDPATLANYNAIKARLNNLFTS